MHSVLDPASPHARLIVALWGWMLGASTVVYVIVIGAVFLALVRGRRDRRVSSADAAPLLPSASMDRAAERGVAVAGIATVSIVLAFLVYDIVVGNAISRQPARGLSISLIGRQWWWEAVYGAATPSDRITTANEIHIPIGEPVEVDLSSYDVIHSFWIPSLGGKKDLIPGRPTRVWIQADTPGVYRGQCAEFCGVQHAHMALFIVAEPKAQFDAWLSGQRRPAQRPTDPALVAGQTVFLTAGCRSCHAIGGTSELATFGPNLTHLGSRLTIASATLSNSPDHLAAWIRDPRLSKPGALMPSNPITQSDLQALVRYLETLK